MRTFFKQDHDQSPYRRCQEGIGLGVVQQGGGGTMTSTATTTVALDVGGRRRRPILIMMIVFPETFRHSNQDTTGQVQDNLMIDRRISTPNEVPSHGSSDQSMIGSFRMTSHGCW
jgi:hypothetical protein